MINITIKAIVYAMISIMADTVTNTTSCGTVDNAVSEIHQYSPISICPSTQSLPTCTIFHNIPPAITINIPLSHQHSPYLHVPPSTTFLQLLPSIFPWGEDFERGLLVDHQS